MNPKRNIRQKGSLPNSSLIFRMAARNPKGYWCNRQVRHIPEHLPDPGASPECAGANQREAGVRGGGGDC